MAAKEAIQVVLHKDDDAGGLTPGKEEDAVMCRLYPSNCCQYL